MMLIFKKVGLKVDNSWLSRLKVKMDKIESQLHKDLVLELVSVFKNKNYKIIAVDGLSENQPNTVNNLPPIVGDGENKIPDIDSEADDGRVIRGEAKCNNGDINSDHSITQYKLFSKLQKNNLSSWLYIIVPKGVKIILQQVLNENLNKNQLKNVGIIESNNYLK